MSTKKKYEYGKPSIDKNLMDIITQFIKDYPEYGYGSVAQFVEEAVRRKAEELRVFDLTPRFTHFNLDENGVKIGDKKLNQKAIQIYIKPQGLFCEYCGTSNCEHINYALEQEDIQEIIRKRKREGWKLPDV